MHGSPWRSWNANEMLHSRNMIMFLLNGLREMGWIMLCSADVSAKYHSDKNDSKSLTKIHEIISIQNLPMNFLGYSLDCHSIFLIKHDTIANPLIDMSAQFPLPDTPPSYFSLYGFN